MFIFVLFKINDLNSSTIKLVTHPIDLISTLRRRTLYIPLFVCFTERASVKKKKNVFHTTKPETYN